MMNQKESVYSAVIAIATPVDNKVSLTKEQRHQVIATVTESIMSGETEFSAAAKAKHDSIEKVKKYVDGLVNNWLRKDTRLNGGDKYEIKNPGSRAGQGDETLKNLKIIRTQTSNPEHVAMIDAEIANRVTELAKTKTKPKEVDLTKIPADLLAKLGL